nr:Transposon Ty3-G Gag-Pol polyprotein [Ipomoea batatas]
MEAKWKANTEKAKAAQQPEMAATTPLSNRQALFRANPGLPIATDEGSSDGAPMVQKHSKGDAFEWFRWMKRNRLIFGWHDFLEKVEQRFGTTHFEDPLAELAKLTQIGTVADFQAAFEKLLNRGHRCKERFLLLIGDEDDETVEGDPVVVEDYHTDEEVISGDVSVLNTMTGPGSPRSLRLTGNIKGSSCLVLIDSGSTHNFINPAIVEILQLPTKSIKPFQVYIGNGDTLGCQHVCPGVEVCMQGLTFAVDLHVLRIVGPDVVLGVQWLQSLGSVTHDYSKMTMEFHMGSTIVTLKGDSGLNNQPISFNQLQAMQFLSRLRPYPLIEFLITRFIYCPTPNL